MRLLVLTVAVLAVTTPVLAQKPKADWSAEQQAAAAPVEHYLQGHATGDGAHMRIAFAPEAKLFFIRGDTLASRTSEEYIAGFSGKPAPDEAQRKRWIESIDVAGNTGVAKVVLDYPATRFVDYLSLLKINGEWKIINKIFYAEPRN